MTVGASGDAVVLDVEVAADVDCTTSSSVPGSVRSDTSSTNWSAHSTWTRRDILTRTHTVHRGRWKWRTWKCRTCFRCLN